MGIPRDRCILLLNKIPKKLFCYHMDHWVGDIIQDMNRKKHILLISVAIGLSSNSKIMSIEILE